jgi:Fic family protein
MFVMLGGPAIHGRSDLSHRFGADAFAADAAWFLGALQRSVGEVDRSLDSVLYKTRFWQRMAPISLNERQVKILNKLLDGFDGKLTSSKWAAIAKCSPDTALRDINDLLTRGVLHKLDAGGRSTHYELKQLM